MQIKSANGISGQLLRTFDREGSNYFFRVYNSDGTFTDYDLAHSDLSITINDEDAFFYEDNESNLLDHSPKTLGISVTEITQK